MSNDYNLKATLKRNLSTMPADRAREAHDLLCETLTSNPDLVCEDNKAMLSVLRSLSGGTEH